MVALLSDYAEFSQTQRQVKAHTRNGKLIRAYSRDEQKVRNKENFKNLAIGAAALSAPSLIGLAATKGKLGTVPAALLGLGGLPLMGVTYKALQGREVRKNPGFYHPKSLMMTNRKTPGYNDMIRKVSAQMNITPKEFERRAYEIDERQYRTLMGNS